MDGLFCFIFVDTDDVQPLSGVGFFFMVPRVKSNREHLILPGGIHILPLRGNCIEKIKGVVRMAVIHILLFRGNCI